QRLVHGGAEDPCWLAFLRERVRRGGQGFGTGTASNRASGMARRPGGVAGNIWLRLSPVWVRHGCLSLAPFCRANRLRPPARLKTKDLQYLVIENPLICSCGASTAGRAAPRDPGSSRKRPSSRRRSPARARGNRRARGAPAAACPLIVSSI